MLNQVQEWVNGYGKGGAKILWLHGPAGAGKSAIAQTVSEICAAKGQLAGSFFFSRSAPSRNNTRHFFTTIALQFAHSIPHMRKEICKAVENDLQILHRQHRTQMKQLIVQPLLSPTSSSLRQPVPFLVIVDGLDECDRIEDQSKLLSQILKLVQTYHLPLLFLIVSRPEPHIRKFFHTTPPETSTKLSLYGDHQAQEDICVFLQSGFTKIHNSDRHADIMKHVRKPWPSYDVVHLLAERSGGYFIYASMLLKYIDEENISCLDRLQEVLNISDSGSAVFAELDELYTQILSTCPNRRLLLRMLGGVLIHTAEHRTVPESVESTQTLLGLRSGEGIVTLRGLHSVLDFLPTKVSPDTSSFAIVKPFHASFSEFLFDETRAGEYYIDQEMVHADMVWGAADLIRDYESRKSSIEHVIPRKHTLSPYSSHS